MKKSCPNFECLDFSLAKCEKYPACEGCHKYANCGNCQNQSALVDKTVVPCDMIDLPEACRSCAKRLEDGFSPEESCPNCWVKARNQTIK